MTHWMDFDNRKWQDIKTIWNAWWQGDLDRALLVLEATSEQDGATQSGKNPHLTQYALDYSVEKALDNVEWHLDRINYMGDAFPKWHPNLGAGFLAGILGSEPEYNNGITWFHPVSPEEMGRIGAPLNPDNVWHQRLSSFYTEAIRRWTGKVVLGYTDIGGNLDVLASLRESQTFLLDLMDQPKQTFIWSQEITARWIELYQQIEKLLTGQPHGQTCWAPILAPGSTYMLQCDFSIMISPRMFKKYVIPDIEACCEVMDYPFYHLDGEGAVRHLNSLLQIEKLCGIQWVPGAGAPPADEWIPLLEKIRNAGKLCQVYVTVDGALKIAEALGQKGFLFYIRDPELPTKEQARSCLEKFEAL